MVIRRDVEENLEVLLDDLLAKEKTRGETELPFVFGSGDVDFFRHRFSVEAVPITRDVVNTFFRQDTPHIYSPVLHNWGVAYIRDSTIYVMIPDEMVHFFSGDLSNVEAIVRSLAVEELWYNATNDDYGTSHSVATSKSFQYLINNLSADVHNFFRKEPVQLREAYNQWTERFKSRGRNPRIQDTRKFAALHFSASVDQSLIADLIDATSGEITQQSLDRMYALLRDPRARSVEDLLDNMMLVFGDPSGAALVDRQLEQIAADEKTNSYEKKQYEDLRKSRNRTAKGGFWRSIARGIHKRYETSRRFGRLHSTSRQYTKEGRERARRYRNTAIAFAAFCGLYDELFELIEQHQSIGMDASEVEYTVKQVVDALPSVYPSKNLRTISVKNRNALTRLYQQATDMVSLYVTNKGDRQRLLLGLARDVFDAGVPFLKVGGPEEKGFVRMPEDIIGTALYRYVLNENHYRVKGGQDLISIKPLHAMVTVLSKNQGLVHSRFEWGKRIKRAANKLITAYQVKRAYNENTGDLLRNVRLQADTAGRFRYTNLTEYGSSDNISHQLDRLKVLTQTTARTDIWYEGRDPLPNL